MSLGGIILGVINVAIVMAVLVLVGAFIVWIAGIFEWPIPWNIQRIYLLIVLLIGIYMLVALMLGMPSIRIIGPEHGLFLLPPSARNRERPPLPMPGRNLPDICPTC